MTVLTGLPACWIVLDAQLHSPGSPYETHNTQCCLPVYSAFQMSVVLRDMSRTIIHSYDIQTATQKILWQDWVMVLNRYDTAFYYIYQLIVLHSDASMPFFFRLPMRRCTSFFGSHNKIPILNLILKWITYIVLNKHGQHGTFYLAVYVSCGIALSAINPALSCMFKML